MVFPFSILLYMYLLMQLLWHILSSQVDFFLYMEQDDKCMLNNDGLPKKDYPNHWKGENGLYCAGFARRGLAGISMDAKSIANDVTEIFFSG